MHAVMRNYSGKGAKELFDVIEKNEALKNHSPVNTSAEHCRRKLQSGILATEADFQEVAKSAAPTSVTGKRQGAARFSFIGRAVPLQQRSGVMGWPSNRPKHPQK